MKKCLLAIVFVVWAVLNSTPVVAQSTPDYWPTKEWLVSSPEKQGMNSEELANYFSTWSQEQFHLDSLLVIRNGYLVAEAYAPLNGTDIKHNLYSVTKTVTATLIGALIQDKLLDGVDTPVLKLFANRDVQNVDARKQALTVRDLLTMSSGLESNEMEAAQLDVPSTDALMEQSDDWVQFALDLPMSREAGTQWYYTNIGPMILSGIITELTGKSAADYAAEKLFAPLGITDYRWNKSSTGISIGASELYLTPRDMAKIGYLYLNHGTWDGKQIISADFATAAIGNQINTPWDSTNYGYLWWRIEPINFSLALGYGGQYIMVLPNSNMVVVMTAGMTEDLRVPLNGYPMFFATASLSASNEALPENPTAVDKLESVITAIANPAKTVVAALPDMANEVSGKNYVLFSPNLFFSSDFVKRSMNSNGLTDAMKVQTLAITFDDSAEAKLNLGFVDGEQWSLPVGLDGLYRVSDGRLGTVGVKGEWLTHDVFRMYLKEGGTAIEYRFDLNYIPSAVNIISFECTSGGAISVLGYAPQ